jgi:hypothetical protein
MRDEMYDKLFAMGAAETLERFSTWLDATYGTGWRYWSDSRYDGEFEQWCETSG